MGTLRIVVLGLLGVAAASTLVTIHLWRESIKKKEDLNALREMTPERLIANCGQPSSDTEPIVLVLDTKTGTATVSRASAESPDKGMAIGRLIEYKRQQNPYWVKFDFTRDIDKQLRPTRWRLTHFASPEVGVSPSDENAYIAIPIFPCMTKNAKYSFP
jgi:hypothetical protein